MYTPVTAVGTFRPQPRRRTVLLVSGLAVLLLLAAFPARAAAPPVPWECSSYDGEARTRCLNACIELQREQIGQLEGQLRAQQSTVNLLRAQADRQAAATAELQRQLLERSTATMIPPLHAYSFPPGPGLGLYLGRSWFYGPSYLYRPYRGFGSYRHWGHRH